MNDFVQARNFCNDFTLVCRGTPIKTHKMMLGTKCGLLKDWIIDNPLESSFITDDDPTHMEKIIQNMYENIPLIFNTDEEAVCILILLDKYLCTYQISQIDLEKLFDTFSLKFISEQLSLLSRKGSYESTIEKFIIKHKTPLLEYKEFIHTLDTDKKIFEIFLKPDPSEIYFDIGDDISPPIGTNIIFSLIKQTLLEKLDYSRLIFRIHGIDIKSKSREILSSFLCENSDKFDTVYYSFSLSKTSKNILRIVYKR